MPDLALPPAETAYLHELVHRLQALQGQRLLGVYLFGSAAYGAYEPGVSDLDVQAVVAEPLAEPEARAIVQRLAHRALPCPARRLELVCYTAAAVNPASRHPHFEINYNTGGDAADHLTRDPGDESSHWFLLDIAVGRELGRALYGPALAQLFAPIPKVWQLEALADSLAWHSENEPASANAVLNACRGWRYALTGRWGSKLAGARWALARPDPPGVVAQALDERRGTAAMDAAAVVVFIARVAAAVREAIARESDTMEAR